MPNPLTSDQARALQASSSVSQRLNRILHDIAMEITQNSSGQWTSAQLRTWADITMFAGQQTTPKPTAVEAQR